MFDRLEAKEQRYRDLELLLQDPKVISNPARYRAAVKEHGSLAKIVGVYRQHREVAMRLEEARSILEEGDGELAELARDEVGMLEERLSDKGLKLVDLLLAEDEGADRSAIL